MMNEYTIKKIKGVLAAVWFLFCLWLVIDGQKTVGLTSLGKMLSGLAGILVLLYLYNRSFNKSDRH